MHKVIEYYRKENYGNSHLYIKDDAIANYITLLTGKKTLTSDHLFSLRGLGFELREVLREK